MMDYGQLFDNLIAGAIGLLLIIGAVYESVTTGSVESSLLVMATAVVSVYVTGRSVRQVNGAKVEALAKSVDALHARFDEAKLPAAQAPANPTADTTTGS